MTTLATTLATIKSDKSPKLRTITFRLTEAEMNLIESLMQANDCDKTDCLRACLLAQAQPLTTSVVQVATPAKATPTKATPTKATPTKATPTKATPAKATPAKAIKLNTKCPF